MPSPSYQQVGDLIDDVRAMHRKVEVEGHLKRGTRSVWDRHGGTEPRQKNHLVGWEL